MPSDPQDEEYCPERESPSEDDVAFVNEAFEDVVIDVNAYTARPKQWTAADFSKARAPYAYDLENDTNNLYFTRRCRRMLSLVILLIKMSSSTKPLILVSCQVSPR